MKAYISTGTAAEARFVRSTKRETKKNKIKKVK
jgi:hypothetical protein